MFRPTNDLDRYVMRITCYDAMQARLEYRPQFVTLEQMGRRCGADALVLPRQNEKGRTEKRQQTQRSVFVPSADR